MGVLVTHTYITLQGGHVHVRFQHAIFYLKTAFVSSQSFCPHKYFTSLMFMSVLSRARPELRIK